MFFSSESIFKKIFGSKCKFNRSFNTFQKNPWDELGCPRWAGMEWPKYTHKVVTYSFYVHIYIHSHLVFCYFYISVLTYLIICYSCWIIFVFVNLVWIRCGIVFSWTNNWNVNNFPHRISKVFWFGFLFLIH